MRAATDFVRPAYGDPSWQESLHFSCLTARDNLRAHFSLRFLTNLGVAESQVIVDSGGAPSSIDVDFSDTQSNLVLGGSRLSDIDLSSGLSVQGVPALSRYELGYDSNCGRVQARLEFLACIDPVDDKVSSLIGAVEAAPVGASPDDPALPGRLDQLMRVTGEVQVDDRFFTVQCLANRAHTWGRVPHSPISNRGADELHFGDELSAVMVADEDSAGWPVARHAYVVRHGGLRRVKIAAIAYGEGTSDVTKHEMTDECGEVYRISSHIATTTSLDSGQNRYSQLRRLSATWNGHTGDGQSVWVSDMRDLQRARQAARRSTMESTDRSEHND